MVDFKTYYEVLNLYSDYAMVCDSADWDKWPEFFVEERKEQLVQVLRDLRDAISGMQDSFAEGELPQMKQVLAQVLLPSFTAWREEARKLLLPWAAV